MKRVASLFFIGLSSLFSACQLASREEKPLDAKASSALSSRTAYERDLAFTFPLFKTPLGANDALGSSSALPEDWYQSVLAAFEPTAIAEGISEENEWRDFRLVSLRIAPCAPLGTTPLRAEEICWPEVRLVWQPVQVNVRVHGFISPFYADDRAIHASYRIAPETFVSESEARRARALMAKIATATEAWQGGSYEPLSATEAAEFASLRDRVAASYLDEAVALREPSRPETDYQTLGLRPEWEEDGSRWDAFRARLSTFLTRHASKKALHGLTAFSAPSGREPALNDLWVFVSFRGQSGALLQEDVTLRSAIDGRLLVSFGKSEKVAARSDDMAIEEGVFEDATAREIQSTVLLSGATRTPFLERLRDRRKVLVPNTTCGSCHKLNDLNFDFHNLSYLEDRELTVSPRVVTDVALDLAWIAKLSARVGERP